MVHFLKSYNASKNVWMGVSVENKKHGVPRIDMLRKVNAYIRFLSLEPLIENIGEIDLSNIDWIIVGGESGPKARPMKPEWVQRIKKQCDQKNILFFFKQWGGWGADGKKRTKKANGRLLFGKTWNNMPAPAQNIFHGMNKTGHFDRSKIRWSVFLLRLLGGLTRIRREGYMFPFCSLFPKRLKKLNLIVTDTDTLY